MPITVTRRSQHDQPSVPLVVTYRGSDLLGKRAPSWLCRTAVPRRGGRSWSSALECVRRDDHEVRRDGAGAAGKGGAQPRAAGRALTRRAPPPPARMRESIGLDGGRASWRCCREPVHLPVKNDDWPQRRSNVVLPAARCACTSPGGPPAGPDAAADERGRRVALLDVALGGDRRTSSRKRLAAEPPVVTTPVGDVRQLLRGLAGCHVCPPERRRSRVASNTRLRTAGSRRGVRRWRLSTSARSPAHHRDRRGPIVPSRGAGAHRRAISRERAGAETRTSP